MCIKYKALPPHFIVTSKTCRLVITEWNSISFKPTQTLNTEWCQNTVTNRLISEFLVEEWLWQEAQGFLIPDS